MCDKKLVSSFFLCNKVLENDKYTTTGKPSIAVLVAKSLIKAPRHPVIRLEFAYRHRFGWAVKSPSCESLITGKYYEFVLSHSSQCFAATFLLTTKRERWIALIEDSLLFSREFEDTIMSKPHIIRTLLLRTLHFWGFCISFTSCQVSQEHLFGQTLTTFTRSCPQNSCHPILGRSFCFSLCLRTEL